MILCWRGSENRLPLANQGAIDTKLQKLEYPDSQCRLVTRAVQKKFMNRDREGAAHTNFRN
jgi:hypothetical protein